jgi:hypothetical protein
LAINQTALRLNGIQNHASAFTPIQELAGHDEAAVVAAPFCQRQFRVKAFQHARQGCARLGEKLFAY